jgi:pimeloyl-ACP methyl ester carboxylesterase
VSASPFGAVSVGERAAELIPNAELHVVPEGGHVPWVLHSTAVAELAEPFLRRAA